MRLIDADALKLTLCVECEYYPNICDGKNTDKCDWDCIYHIEHAPTIDAVEVVHGKWEERYIEDANPLFRRRFYCSRCGNWTTYGKTLYCPNCGAKMDGERRDPCS